MASTPTIHLDERERRLKDLLLDVAHYIDAHPNDKTKSEPVVLRWAGGWVRDKLLGIQSHDIDTAINTMTGEAFALRLREYIQSESNMKKHAIRPEEVKKYTVARNPEKSKHLETTTLHLFGLDIDFVNLRRETYAEDSRNPQMEFGTAEEDAQRRDATVNALFYRLDTESIEDFTGGLPDLEAKLMRTPLEPLKTFTDDPLRVLRLIRFASRLEFAIDPAAEKVMSDQTVLDKLKVKISRERVGVELEKMLKGEHRVDISSCGRGVADDKTGKHPRVALDFIDELGLYHTIFTDPGRPQMATPDTKNWSAVYTFLDFLTADNSPDSLFTRLATNDEAKYAAWVFATVVPWEQLPDDPPKRGKLALPLPSLVAREGFKAPNKISDIITAAHRHRPEMVELKDVVQKADARVSQRDYFGMAIIRWDSRGGHWRLQLLYAILADVVLRTRNGGDVEGVWKDVLAEWKKLLDHIAELNLMDVPQLKRLVDGRLLGNELGLKPGRWVAPALDIALAWQLRNPEAADPAGALEEVKKRRGELGV